MTLSLSLSMALLTTTCQRSSSAYAVSQDVSDVVKTSLWGAAGGTALGLVAFPITGEFKNIFVGSSIGLYMGIAAGLYLITHRDDPNNPLVYKRVPSKVEIFRENTEPKELSSSLGSPPWVSYTLRW